MELAIIAALFIGFILKFPFIKAPLDRDYGIFGYHALFWLRGKKVPYKDTQENHPPGRWLWYALLLKLFPVSRWLFRVSNLIFLVATNVVVFFIANILYGPQVAIISTLGFAILSSLPTFVWTQSSDEIEQILFTALAVLGVVMADGNNGWLYFAIGCAGFLALFFKQSAYVNTLPVIIVALIVKGTSLTMFLWFFAGLGLGFGFTALFFKSQGIPFHYYRFIFALDTSALKIHLDNILYRRKRGNKPAARETTPENPVEQKNDPFRFDPHSAHRKWLARIVKALLAQTNFFIPLVIVSAVGLINRPASFMDGVFVVWLWMGLVIIAIVLNRHTMAIHFIPLLAPLAILSGDGLVTGYHWLAEKLGDGAAVGGLAGLGILSIWTMRRQIKQWITLEKKGRGHIFVYDQEWEFNSAGEGVGKYLADVVEENDRIYVWGPEYEIYLWAGRPSPTHNLFCPRPQVTFTPDPLAAEKNLVDRLSVALPKFIVITALTDGFNRFRRLLDTHYSLERKMYGGFEIYRRNNTLGKAAGNNSVLQTKPLVSIIILTFNAFTVTRQCVQSIRENTRHPHEIIFVDNASTDETLPYLKKLVHENENYHLVENETNRGFAAGNNQGMAMARGDYYLLLNNDVLVSEGWLERLVACGEADASIGLVGPLTNWISGWQRVMDVPYSDPADFSPYAARIAEKQAGRYTPRRRIAGFAMLIKRNLYEQIGGLDERFGSGNYEDDDYCLRAAEAGYAIMVAEDVFIHHFGSRSFRDNRIDYADAIRRNKQLFSDKWPEVCLDELMEKTGRLTELNVQLNHLAYEKLRTGDTKKAEKLFSRVLAANPLDQQALWGMILYSRTLNNPSVTLGYIKRLLRRNPDHAGAFCQLGVMAAEAGDITRAKSLLSMALQKDPSYDDARRNLGDIMALENPAGISYAEEVR